jgi:stage II sporulation protein AA (anti-sigma F factor antagonist)
MLPDDQQPLLVDVDPDSDQSILRMVVAGEIEDLSAEQLRTTFGSAVRRHRPVAVEMDVRGVTFLDAAGIRALVLCQADAQRFDCRLTVVRAQPIVRRVLEICGLLDHFGLKASDVVTDPEDQHMGSRADER